MLIEDRVRARGLTLAVALMWFAVLVAVLAGVAGQLWFATAATLECPVQGGNRGELLMGRETTCRYPAGSGDGDQPVHVAELSVFRPLWSFVVISTAVVLLVVSVARASRAIDRTVDRLRAGATDSLT